jgi:hypothetical protein
MPLRTTLLTAAPLVTRTAVCCIIDLHKDTTVRGGAALVAYHHPATP